MEKRKAIAQAMAFLSCLICSAAPSQQELSQLGHYKTTITSDIYTHIFKEYKAKMAENIEKAFI